MEELQGSSESSKTGGIPEGDALKNTIGELPSNDDVDAVTD